MTTLSQSPSRQRSANPSLVRFAPPRGLSPVAPPPRDEEVLRLHCEELNNHLELAREVYQNASDSGDQKIADFSKKTFNLTRSAYLKAIETYNSKYDVDGNPREEDGSQAGSGPPHTVNHVEDSQPPSISHNVPVGEPSNDATPAQLDRMNTDNMEEQLQAGANGEDTSILGKRKVDQVEGAETEGQAVVEEVGEEVAKKKQKGKGKSIGKRVSVLLKEGRKKVKAGEMEDSSVEVNSNPCDRCKKLEVACKFQGGHASCDGCNKVHRSCEWDGHRARPKSTRGGGPSKPTPKSNRKSISSKTTLPKNSPGTRAEGVEENLSTFKLMDAKVRSSGLRTSLREVGRWESSNGDEEESDGISDTGGLFG